jgi:hypothetical protein
MVVKSRLSQTNPRAMGTNPRAAVRPVETKVSKPVPKGRAETAAEKAANETTGGIVAVKRSALSVDVGPRVIHALWNNSSREMEITDELNQLQGRKQYEQLSQLTMAIIKAARADKSIDLSVLYEGEKKAMEKLNNQLGIALGFREVKSEPDKNGVVYESVVTSASVGDCFPMPGETETNTTDFNRKRTFRSNFLTQLKKCAMGAHSAIEQNIDVKFDEKAGTLLISGPAVKKHFGQERVLLDERKTVGLGDARVELSEKPSFTSLGHIGAAALGVASVTGAGNHRTRQAGTVGGTLAAGAAKAAEVTGKESLDAAILTICKSLRTALEKTKELSKNAVAALEETKNAIEVRLAN